MIPAFVLFVATSKNYTFVARRQEKGIFLLINT